MNHMRNIRMTCGAMLGLFLGLMVTAQTAKPYSEAELLKLVELVGEQAVLKSLAKQGINFDVNDVVLGRLKAAGASDRVLEAVKKYAKPKKPVVKGKAVTFADVLKLVELGVDERHALVVREKPAGAGQADAAGAAGDDGDGLRGGVRVHGSLPAANEWRRIVAPRGGPRSAAFRDRAGPTTVSRRQALRRLRDTRARVMAATLCDPVDRAGRSTRSHRSSPSRHAMRCCMVSSIHGGGPPGAPPAPPSSGPLAMSVPLAVRPAERGEISASRRPRRPPVRLRSSRARPCSARGCGAG